MALANGDDDAQRTLVTRAYSSDFATRTAALRGLGFAARADEPVLKAFENAIENPVSRVHAYRALEWLGDGGTSLLKAARKDWKELRGPELTAVIRATGKWDPDASGFVTILASIVQKGARPDVQLAAIAALGNGEKSISKRRKTLQNVLNDEANEGAPAYAAAACLSLEKIGKPVKGSVDAVAEWTTVQDRQARIFALRALESFGPEADVAAVVVSRSLGSSDALVRLSALRAFAAMGPGIGEVTTSLGVHATWDDPELVKLGLTALESAGADARPALPYLGVVLLRETTPRSSKPGWTDTKHEDGDLAPLTREPSEPSSGCAENRARAAELIASIAEAHPADAPLARALLDRGTRATDPSVAAASRAALERIGQ